MPSAIVMQLVSWEGTWGDRHPTCTSRGVTALRVRLHAQYALYVSSGGR